MNKTLDYYDNNAKAFAENTSNIVFSEIQDTFLAELKNGASVLDFGCGSGRDTCYFLKKGYKVTALDGSAELCRIAEEKTGNPVIQMDFNDCFLQAHFGKSCNIKMDNLACPKRTMLQPDTPADHARVIPLQTGFYYSR